MTATETRQAIESILMVADSPVEPTVLAQLLEVPKAEVEAMCEQLAEEYEAADRGFVLARVAGGYRFQSHPDLAPYVERFVLDGQSSRLSSAALETLAIVAYKQPISRMQIAAIRGVNVDGVLRTLQQRGYVDEVSRDPGPGNAVLFGTTDLFLERVGLDSTADLPPLAEFVPGADVVEALEDGLRPDPVVEPASADQPSTDQPSADLAETDEPEIDVVDAEAVDPVDVESVDADVEIGVVDPADTEAGTEDTEVDVADLERGATEVDVADLEPGATEVDVADLEADVADPADVEVVAVEPDDADSAEAADIDVAVSDEPASAVEDDDDGPEIDLDEVVDLVAEDDALDAEETHERPSELHEELAAIDALHSDLAEADSDDTPTWSPAESSAVTTVRHDDPPEADTAAPFRPTPGHGGSATAGAHGSDVASGQDLGSGQAAPLMGPDTGDD